jgi:RHS repeat-associated protein
MLSAEFKKGAESLASIGYERDPLGQVEAMVAEGLPGPEEETYEYDENNRLVKAGTEAFEYDKADNPTKIPGSTNAFDKASQLETGTGVAYAYNPMGERVKATPAVGPATSYAYDQAGRLTSVKRAAEGETPAIDTSYSFDGSGLLASRTSGLSTKHFAWDPSASLPLLLDDGENSYVYGPYGLPIIQIDAEEEPTYLHHDQLGSTRLLTDAGGKAAGSFTYTAYGQLAAKTGTATTPLGYAGQYTDADTGLQYLRARFYDPITAQFLSLDPLRAGTHMPYGYAQNSPVNGVDPTGLLGWGDVGNFLKGTAESLNPIKYYEEEIECIEEGCSYWESVLKGSQGAVTAACDVTGFGALGKGLLGRGGSLIGREAAGALAGSTGRAEAANLTEQLAMQAARSNPAAGRVLEVTMSDPQWPASAGWVKMAQNINGVEVHYVYNVRTGLAADFKFKP